LTPVWAKPGLVVVADDQWAEDPAGSLVGDAFGHVE
jgi:hypothetical protein